MQFRQKTHRDKDGNIRQGQTVQLMRYTYDAENKRGRQVMIGSFKVEDPRLPPEVEALLHRRKRPNSRSGNGHSSRPSPTKSWPPCWIPSMT